MRLFIVFAVALGGFALFLPQTQFKAKGSSPLTHWLPGLPAIQSSAAALWTGMVTGDDRTLSSEVKKSYYRLGLGHLFTPSGVHLAALSPALRKLPFTAGIYLSIGLLATLTPGLLALGRVAWLKSLGHSGKAFSFFVLMMLLEGALYSWSEAPLSWVCSWLFLGITYFAPKPLRWAWFIVGQVLLCWVLHQPLSLLVLPAALLLGLPLGLIFPVLLILAFIPYSPLHTLTLQLIQRIHDMVMWTDQLHQHLPAIIPHAGHFGVATAFLCVRGCHKTLAVAVSLLMLSSPVGPWSKSSSYSPTRETVPAKSAFLLKSSYQKDKIVEVWSDGVKCRRSWNGGIWKGNCRARKTRQL